MSASDPIWFTPPPRPRQPPAPPEQPEVKQVDIQIDGQPVRVPETMTILDACRSLGIDTPTLCFLENLTPVNVCRVCVVELAGARTLAPACSRKVEAGMQIKTNSDRVKLARKMVLEFLGSSVDLSTAPQAQSYIKQYEARPERYGSAAETVHQPVKVDNDLYVRDYSKCILCYKCVEACGADAQNTFAIAVAGRGFDARISTEDDVPLPDSACVYCGNCIGVCPTGALMFKSENDLRADDAWDESAQTVTRTICPYCGVGCNPHPHAQKNEMVKAPPPMAPWVTGVPLCIRGRFGFEFVQNREEPKD